MKAQPSKPAHQTPLETWYSPVGTAAQSYLRLYQDGQFEYEVVGDTAYDVKREDGSDPNIDISRGNWQHTASGITLSFTSGDVLKLKRYCYSHEIYMSEHPGKDTFDPQSKHFSQTEPKPCKEKDYAPV